MRTYLVISGLVLATAVSGCSNKKKATTLPSVSEQPPSTQPKNQAPASGVTVDNDGGAGEPGSFHPIYFAFDSSELLPEARQELEQLAMWLGRTNATVQIEGHADQHGTAEYNLALGERRAEAIRAYLVRIGVAPERLSTISFGEERPVAAGDDETSWSKNRRGELVLGQH
jgi:peptidoglycan-associated lipoprotein